MSDDTPGDAPGQQIERLLDELYELKMNLREISQKVSRIENRAKRSFPTVAGRKEAVARRDRENRGEAPTLTREAALQRFDSLRELAEAGDTRKATDELDSLSLANLTFLAKELGLTLGKSKRSRRYVTNAIFGRVKQSIMLRQHTNVRSAKES